MCCVEQICGTFWLRYDSGKLMIDKEKLKLGWKSGRDMKSALSASLKFLETKEVVKSGPGKY